MFKDIVYSTVCPCKDCSDRHCACSDSCSKYKEYKANLGQEKKWQEENKSPMYSSHYRPYTNLSKSGREEKGYHKLFFYN